MSAWVKSLMFCSLYHHHIKLKIEKNGSGKEDFNISTFLFWSWVSNTTTNWWHPLEKLKESVYVSWLLIGNHLNDFFGFLLKLWIKNYFQILLTVFLDVMAGASNPKEGRIFFFSFSERFAKKGWSSIRFGLCKLYCCTLFTIYIQRNVLIFFKVS